MLEILYRINGGYYAGLWELQRDCLSLLDHPARFKIWQKAVEHGGDSLHRVAFWFFEFAEVVHDCR